MVKSPNPTMKFFLLPVALCLLLAEPTNCQPVREKLNLADSLFAQKKYTQSYDLYQAVLEQHQKVSPAMLLKMAFVKEGLGDYSNALYYLNLYYKRTYDKKVLKKMEILAEEHNLSGYNYDDAAFFLNLYHQFQLQIDLLVTSMLLLIFAIIFYNKRRTGVLSRPGVYGFLFLMAMLFVINNFGREHGKAIISSEQAHIMDGPSPGANVVDVVSAGHRVEVLGRKDVWVEISWLDQSAFIKEFELKTLEL
jgi:hypothetical protein